MDERLKPLIIPALALVLLAAWFFFIRPMMSAQDPPYDDPAGTETG